MNNIQLMNEGFDRQFTKARRLMEAHEAFKQYLDMLGKKNLLLKDKGGMGTQNAAHVVKSWASSVGTTVAKLNGLKAKELGESWLRDALQGAKGKFIWVSGYAQIPEELRKKYLYPFLQKGRIIATANPNDLNTLNRDERNAFMVFDVSTMRGSKGQKWTESYKRKGLKEGFVKLNNEPIEITYVDSEEGDFVPAFDWNGETYYLDDFIRCHNNPWGEIDCPDYIHAYDSTNYYNPIFIGVDDSGEYVDIYEQSEMDESYYTNESFYKHRRRYN